MASLAEQDVTNLMSQNMAQDGTGQKSVFEDWHESVKIQGNALARGLERACRCSRFGCNCCRRFGCPLYSDRGQIGCELSTRRIPFGFRTRALPTQIDSSR